MIGATAFAAVVWGAVALVLGIFLYEVVSLAREGGLT